MVESPFASIIILTWNGCNYIEACLASVLAQDYSNFEVIVVDNASSDGTAELVAKKFPQIQLIVQDRNLGFAGGNNVGLRAATGEMLVLLNQDTVVEPTWLATLVETLLADSDIGIAGGKALYPDKTIQHAGGYINERGEGTHYGQSQADTGQFDQKRDVDYITGATLAITRRAFETIGELDEGFAPAYHEDVDWCYRARRAGFRVVYVPEVRLIHKETSTLADGSHKGMYFLQRSRLRFVFKHWSLEQLVETFLPAERTWLESLGEGAERIITVMHHTYLYHLLHLADLMTSRQALQGVPLTEVDVLADILLTLRAVAPLDLSQIGAKLPLPVQPLAKPDVLAELHQSWLLKAYQFRSEIPFIGPLVAAFRRQWHRIAAKWSIQSLINQQNAINAKMVTLLVHHERRLEEHERLMANYASLIAKLGQQSAEYTAEHQWEIEELAQEIHKIKLLYKNKNSVLGSESDVK